MALYTTEPMIAVLAVVPLLQRFPAFRQTRLPPTSAATDPALASDDRSADA